MGIKGKSFKGRLLEIVEIVRIIVIDRLDILSHRTSLFKCNDLLNLRAIKPDLLVKRLCRVEYCHISYLHIGKRFKV